MNHLITKANNLLKDGNFDYAVCGGFALELFLNTEIRKHGDIDIAVFWEDRDKIILYMQTLGWQVYEMCGNGIAHHITDISVQKIVKRNIFCFKDKCDLVSLTQLNEKDMYHLDFNHKGQSEFNFIEFLFNDRTQTDFLYARNHEISLDLSKAILYNTEIPYLAPELILLYKSTDIYREGYQTDYDYAIKKLDIQQKLWFKNALLTMNPSGHEWIADIN